MFNGYLSTVTVLKDMAVRVCIRITVRKYANGMVIRDSPVIPGTMIEPAGIRTMGASLPSLPFKVLESSLIVSVHNAYLVIKQRKDECLRT